MTSIPAQKPMITSFSTKHQDIVNSVETWLERAVIGLNLCPFARAVHIRKQIRYVVSEASEVGQLVHALREELNHLHTCDPVETETTLLIHPWVLTDFIDYNEFLGVTEIILDEMGLEGEIQIASFHPDYQFADTQHNDISNFTNRSPYPILHLLRESSIDKAVTTVPDTDAIYKRNIATLKQIGHEGWLNLFKTNE
jgi:uncharacterized protein